MLKTTLLHPDILAALAGSGHFSQVLIADGNFPVLGNRGPNARVVHLNLSRTHAVEEPLMDTDDHR